MKNKFFIIGLGLFIIIGMTEFFLMKKDKQNLNANQMTEDLWRTGFVSAPSQQAPLAQSSQATSHSEHVAPKPVLEGDDSITQIVNSLIQSTSGSRDPKVRQQFEILAQNPTAALQTIEQKLQSIPSHEVQQRAALFGALIELTVTARKLQVPNYKQFVRASIQVVQNQLLQPELVEAPIPQGATSESLDEMGHHDLYVHENGKLLVHTFKAKFMGLAVLKEAQLPEASLMLNQVTLDPKYGPKIREAARNLEQLERN